MKEKLKIIAICLLIISCSQKVRVVVKDIGANGCDDIEEEHIENKARMVRTLYCKKKGEMAVEWSVDEKIGSLNLNKILKIVQNKIENGVLKGRETIGGVKVIWKAEDKYNYKIKMKEKKIKDTKD